MNVLEKKVYLRRKNKFLSEGLNTISKLKQICKKYKNFNKRSSWLQVEFVYNHGSNYWL